jgi:hypothetical protein
MMFEVVLGHTPATTAVWIAWGSFLIDVGVGLRHGVVRRFVRHGLESFQWTGNQ